MKSLKQVGGYFEEYATEGSPLTFLTVKGAGHMVPKVLMIIIMIIMEKEDARVLLPQ